MNIKTRIVFSASLLFGLVGAIGISAAPGGEKDAACAQAGIDKIAKGLGG